MKRNEGGCHGRRWARAKGAILGLGIACTLATSAGRASAQTVTTRGFVELRGDWYPLVSPTDRTHGVGDLHARLEAATDLTPWLRVRGALDARLDTYGQVERTWAVDWFDRARRRRPLALRELNVTVARGRFTADVGKQFVRWGDVDFINPTDRFAPHDYLAVVDDELLAVWAARVAYGGDANRVQVVWAPRFTPSRIPLYDKRWTVVPDAPQGLVLLDAGARWPRGAQTGVRWTLVAPSYEYAVSYYDGFHHLPVVDASALPTFAPAPVVALAQRFPRLRSAGLGLGWPLPWFTLKSEAGYFWAPERDADEYLLYVIQVERQRGELFVLAGYAGEVVSVSRRGTGFAPDRGLARAIVGKASYAIDPNRRVEMELAVRQTLDGLWLKGEYSHAVGAHWRATLGGSLIRGSPGDFIGQFRRNSHLFVTWRCSF